MVRPGLRRSEIDWENVDIHISREEMEREQEHEAAIQRGKTVSDQKLSKVLYNK